MSKEKNSVVKLEEKVKVYGTGKSQFMPKNEEFEVHPIHAETLIKQGKASKEKLK